MKLSLEGIKSPSDWEAAGIALPGYNIEAAARKAQEAPRWAHFGIGNIFRIFIGSIADGLLLPDFHRQYCRRAAGKGRAGYSPHLCGNF